MQKPLVSVVVTAFEQPRSLALLLCTLNAQDFEHPFEVLVCDDGSSVVDFQECLSQMPKLNLDLRYLWQPNRGHRAARSRNNGIRCAQGDYLVFLDADIIVKSDFLRSHVAAHTEARLMVCNPRRWLLEPAESLMPPNIKKENVLDIEAFLTAAETRSVDVDRSHQRQSYASTTPWLACVGFSFSVRKHSAITFDEQFEGWGPEDRELALRLVSQHGYSVRYCDDIEVFHLESCSTGRAPISGGAQSTMLPKQHDQIVAFFRNVIYFAQKHPRSNLGELLKMLLLYRLHEGTNRWSYQSITVNPDRSTQEKVIDEHVRFIEAWLERENSLAKVTPMN